MVTTELNSMGGSFHRFFMAPGTWNSAWKSRHLEQRRNRQVLAIDDVGDGRSRRPPKEGAAAMEGEGAAAMETWLGNQGSKYVCV